jgi:hypothetical protein
MNWDDVVAIATELPETAADTWWGTPGLKVRGKGFGRLRTEAEGGLMLLCSLDEKEGLLASGDPGFFITPHYENYGAILIDLDRVDRQQLTELITEAWRLKATPKLLAQFDG